MATKKITIKAPPSTTEQTITVDVTVPDITILETSTITGTTPPTTPVNQPPVVSISGLVAIQIQQGQTGQTILTANASDPENKAITVLWEKTSGPGTITAPTARTTTITGLNADAGIKVTVTDEGGLQASASVMLKVVTVAPPPVDPPDVPAGSWPTWTPFSQNDWETSITQGFNSYIQQPDRATTMFLSTDFVRSGTKSLKIDISKAQADAGANWRSELTHIDIDNAKAGDERWYEFYMYCKDYQSDNEESIFQIHQSAGTGSPPSAIYINGNKLIYNYITTFNGPEKNTGSIALPINKWFRVRVHYIYGTSATTGLSEVWIDDALLVSLKAANIYSGQTNYLKLGLYKWAWKNGVNNPAKVLRRILYYDGWKAWKK